MFMFKSVGKRTDRNILFPGRWALTAVRRALDGLALVFPATAGFWFGGRRFNAAGVPLPVSVQEMSPLRNRATRRAAFTRSFPLFFFFFLFLKRQPDRPEHQS